MTTIKSTNTWAARWSAMSDKTRMAVSVAIALASVLAVMLGAKAGPLLTAVCTWMMVVARMLAVTPQSVAGGYLVALYGATLAVAWAHASRTQVARAQRRPKPAGKPPVGVGAKHAWLAAMVASSAASFLLLLGLYSGMDMPPAVWAGAIFGPFLTWLILGVVVAIRSAENGPDPTYSSSVRVVGIVHGGIATAVGFSVENLGLLVGLWVLMYLLCALEKNELPVDYPESFGGEQFAEV